MITIVSNEAETAFEHVGDVLRRCNEAFAEAKARNVFTPARDIKWQNSACYAAFDCPCGREEISLCDGGDEYECDCGRVYRLDFTIKVDVDAGPNSE